MSTRTRRRLLLFILASVAVLAVGAWLLWPRTAITRENAAKIKEGMTLAEVEAILGGPARNESDMPDNFINDAFVMNGEQPFTEKRWASPGRVVILHFDDSCRVIRRTTTDFGVDHSLFDMVRRWFRR
jgi:hypothetical protein